MNQSKIVPIKPAVKAEKTAEQRRAEEILRRKPTGKKYGS